MSHKLGEPAERSHLAEPSEQKGIAMATNAQKTAVGKNTVEDD